MKGGQNKKTRAQLKLAGTERADRHGESADDVVFEDGMPHMPEMLSDTAKKVWNRAYRSLKAANQLKPAYEVALAGYAALAGEFMDDPIGFPANRHGQLRMYIQELGLGPVSATRLRGDSAPPKGGGDFGDV